MSNKYNHNLHFDLAKAGDDDLLDVFPELDAYPEFQVFRGKELNKFIIYCFYAYDPGSAFTNKIKDITKRKEQAMTTAGLDIGDERSVNAMAMQDRQVNAMVTCFLRYFVQNHDFQLWLSGCEMIAQLLEGIRKPINESDLKDDAAQRANKTRMENFTELPKLIKQVKDLEVAIFGNDTGLKESAAQVQARTNMGAVERFLNKDKD